MQFFQHFCVIYIYFFIISGIENETRVSFVLDDDEFANLKQNLLVVAVDEYEHECEHDHESLVDEMAWTQKSIYLESPSDGIVNLTRWDYENATNLGRYKIFNVTDIVSRIISETNVNNLARKSSTVIGFHFMNVTECISIESGNSSPLLVAFDDFEFGNIETDFFLNQRENSDQKSAPLMPRLRDGMKVRNRRKTPDTSCQVRDWYVDFTEVGLDHLIYVPSGYHANFCYGSCHYEHFQTEVEKSRDAIVRGISRRHIHSHDQCGDTTMPPCATCVPSSFAPLTLIYRTERSNFVIDSAQNMTVTACTCI